MPTRSFLFGLAFLAALPAQANIVISELDLNNSKVELVNTGDSDVNLTGNFWCNRVNGSPFYRQVSAAHIDAANTTATGLLVKPREVITFSLGAAFLPPAGGELGLYSTNSNFGSRANMIDYLNYGTSTGTRDSVARQVPAIWILNQAIALTGMGPADTIQLRLETPGNSAADYMIAPSTLGLAQSLPPPVFRMTDFGFVDADTWFVEYEYTGTGTVKATESTDLVTFTDVSARTPVASPSPNRLEFDIAGPRLFFRLETP